MTDERDRAPGQEPDDATGTFDADAWFRAQFGGAPEPAASPPLAEPAPAPIPPVLVEPVVPPLAAPPAPPAPPLGPPVAPAAAPPAAFAVPPLASAPPPTSVPVPLPPPSVVEPLLAPPMPVIEPEPTQPAEVVPPGGAIGDAATELLREPEVGESLDQLFGESSFQEYDDTLIPAPPRSERRARRGSGGDAAGGSGGDGSDGGEPAARAPLGRTQKVLLWVAGGLAAVLALVAVFVVGTRIPLLLGPAPGAEPISSASPSPTASLDAGPVGPVSPGDYRWDELRGGECLEPFIDAWQDTVTVVDCATPHGGQLVLRAELPLEAGARTAGPYPGEPLLASQTLQLCSSAGVLDLAVAGEFRDIVLQAAFPVSPEEWDAGERDYFCFVSRSSGEPLTASLVGSGPAPTVLPTAPPAG